jgi:hypothetical protein
VSSYSHVPKDHQESPNNQEPSEVAPVVDGSHKGANKQHHQGLYGADPCYVAATGLEQRTRFVVRLIHTKRVQKTLKEDIKVSLYCRLRSLRLTAK